MAVLALSLRATPSDLLVAVQAGQAAMAAGDYAGAATAFRRIDAYQPWAIEWLTAVVDAEVRAGEFAAAEHDLNRLASLRPLSAAELLWWGTIYEGQGCHLDALQAWERAWSQGAFDADVVSTLAQAYLDRGDRIRARAALENLAQMGAADGDQLYQLGLLQALDAPDRAVATLTQVAASNPTAARRLIPLLDALDRRTSEPPEQYFTRLGAAFLTMGEMGLAETALEWAVLYNPVYGESLAYLAYVWALQGKPALGAAQQAAAISPDNPAVLYLVGLTWKQVGRPYEARLAFERAFELDRSNPAFAAEIAATHRLEANDTLAEIWMEEAVRLAPGDLRFELLMAQFYVDEEYRVADRGLPLALDVVRQAPDSAEAHATLGWAYFLTGDLGGAFAELDTALALNPDLPRANAHKGALLESQGRIDEAVTYYTRAAELEPDGPFGALARRALERIANQ